jgi:hypothetical protein
MQSVVSLRGAYSLAARSVVGAGLLVAVSLGCSVDDSGLAGTSEKLQRDGGGGGGLAMTGSGGGVGTGGVNGGGGSVGTGGVTGGGGTIAGGTGGTPGTGGMSATGGAPGSGGALGAGGVMATGGVTGAGGTPSTGGTTGSGAAPGTGGATSTGGMTGTGGATSTGGSPGTGGTPGTGGQMGTGGAGGTKCGSGNCDGCCSADGQCVKTTSAKQCGSMGAACVACAPCEICSTQTSSGMGPPTPGSGGVACAIDPTSQWTIVAVSGQVTMSPPGGGTWDPAHGDEGGSAPDLFCEYENPANDVSATTAGVTDTVTDVFTANWDETITPPGVTVSASALMAQKPAWRIWVGDEDCVSPDNCGTLGQIACSYQQPITAASLESGQVTISNYQSCVSLTLQLVCQAPATTP